MRVCDRIVYDTEASNGSDGDVLRCSLIAEVEEKTEVIAWINANLTREIAPAALTRLDAPHAPAQPPTFTSPFAHHMPTLLYAGTIIPTPANMHAVAAPSSFEH